VADGMKLSRESTSSGRFLKRRRDTWRANDVGPLGSPFESFARTWGPAFRPRRTASKDPRLRPTPGEINRSLEGPRRRPRPKSSRLLPDQDAGSVFGVRPCDCPALLASRPRFLAGAVCGSALQSQTRKPSASRRRVPARPHLLLRRVRLWSRRQGRGRCHADPRKRMASWPRPAARVARNFLASVAGGTAVPLAALRPGPRPEWWTGLPDPKALYANFDHPILARARHFLHELRRMYAVLPDLPVFHHRRTNPSRARSSVCHRRHCQRSDSPAWPRAQPAPGRGQSPAPARAAQVLLHSHKQNPGLVGCTAGPLRGPVPARPAPIRRRVRDHETHPTRRPNVLRDPLLPLPARISERIDGPPNGSLPLRTARRGRTQKPSAICPASSARSRPLARVNPPLSLPAIRPGRAADRPPSGWAPTPKRYTHLYAGAIIGSRRPLRQGLPRR